MKAKGNMIVRNGAVNLRLYRISKPKDRHLKYYQNSLKVKTVCKSISKAFWPRTECNHQTKTKSYENRQIRWIVGRKKKKIAQAHVNANRESAKLGLHV
jgi:hypothetical protein